MWDRTRPDDRLAPGCPAGHRAAVSYTHLDVYKRQATNDPIGAARSTPSRATTEERRILNVLPSRRRLMPSSPPLVTGSLSVRSRSREGTPGPGSKRLPAPISRSPCATTAKSPGGPAADEPSCLLPPIISELLSRADQTAPSSADGADRTLSASQGRVHAPAGRLSLTACCLRRSNHEFGKRGMLLVHVGEKARVERRLWHGKVEYVQQRDRVRDT